MFSVLSYIICLAARCAHVCGKWSRMCNLISVWVHCLCCRFMYTLGRISIVSHFSSWTQFSQLAECRLLLVPYTGTYTQICTQKHMCTTFSHRSNVTSCTRIKCCLWPDLLREILHKCVFDRTLGKCYLICSHDGSLWDCTMLISQPNPLPPFLSPPCVRGWWLYMADSLCVRLLLFL